MDVQVICDPHITETRLGLDAQYLVVASDGLTEQWSISGAAQAVCDLARLGHSPSNIASMISNKCVIFQRNLPACSYPFMSFHSVHINWPKCLIMLMMHLPRHLSH